MKFAGNFSEFGRQIFGFFGHKIDIYKCIELEQSKNM